MNCSIEEDIDRGEHAIYLGNLFNWIVIATYSIAIVMFTAVLFLISAARSRFHRLFSLFFSLVIIGYIVCDAMMVMTSLLYVSNYYISETYIMMDIIYQSFYIYMTCMVIFCVMERFSATVFSKSYESRKYWFVLLFSQVVAGVIVCINSYSNRYEGMASNVVQVALSCANLTILCILLLVNRHMRKKTRGVGALSFRYQISENVRVLRLLTPVVLLHTSVTTTDLVGSTVFKVGFDFDGDRYTSDPEYLTAYVILRAMATFLEYCIPIVTFTHKTLREQVSVALSKVLGVPSSRQNEVDDAQVARVGPHSFYFDYLHNQWKK